MGSPAAEKALLQSRPVAVPVLQDQSFTEVTTEPLCEGKQGGCAALRSGIGSTGDVVRGQPVAGWLSSDPCNPGGSGWELFIEHKNKTLTQWPESTTKNTYHSSWGTHWSHTYAESLSGLYSPWQRADFFLTPFWLTAFDNTYQSQLHTGVLLPHTCTMTPCQIRQM